MIQNENHPAINEANQTPRLLALFRVQGRDSATQAGSKQQIPQNGGNAVRSEQEILERISEASESAIEFRKKAETAFKMGEIYRARYWINVCQTLHEEIDALKWVLKS